MSDFFTKITAPIPGDDPFGSDVNHDPDYERLKGEMGKLGDIDVHLVDTLSLKILSEKSKDVRAMAFLAYSALRKGDLERLADVIGALADYCRDDFDLIFPRRDGAKLAALRWLSEPRFTSRCPLTQAAASDAEHVARLKDALGVLRPALEKRFSYAGAPFPLLLYKRVAEWEKAIEGAAAVETVRDDGNNSDRTSHSVGQSGNQSSGQSVSKNDRPETHENQTSGNNIDDSGNAGDPQEIITIKMTRGEMREIFHCARKMETLLKKFA